MEEIELEELLDSLDFDEYNYYYHETNKDNSDKILETGLIIAEDNIGNILLSTNNIAESTMAKLNLSDVESIDKFENFIENEVSNGIRIVDSMVILQIPKDDNNYVQKVNTVINGIKVKGIINADYILGVIDMKDVLFKPTDNFYYGNSNSI